LHSGAAAIAVVSAIAARVVATGGRIRLSPRTLVVGAVVLFLLGGVVATGTVIAWKGGVPSDRGMFLAAGRSVLSGTHRVTADGLMVSFVVHSVLGVCSFLVLAWPAARSLRQRPRRLQ
jgi:hypothetical protein